MHEPAYIFYDKIRWFIFGISALVGFLLLAIILIIPRETSASSPEKTTFSSTSFSSEQQFMSSDSPNIITNGMGSTADSVTRSLAQAERSFMTSTRTIATNVSDGSQAVANGLGTGLTNIAKGVGSGASLAAKGVGSGATYLGQSATKTIAISAQATSTTFSIIAAVPGAILGFTTDAPLISSVIKPSDDIAVPMIDSAMIAAASGENIQPVTEITAVSAVLEDTKPQWPISGQVTTSFGVPHWPYQVTHTGIDISDGTRSGITPIKPYRPGMVTKTVYSNYGLGNYVVVDHGEGITSVYAHFSTITVETGQNVTKSTVLGTQGSTGASTGPHLHFEIKINGQAMDPRLFIEGNP